MPDNKIKENLFKAKLYIFVSNFVAALLFFMVYKYTDSELFLVAATLNIAVIIFVYFLFQRLEKKYSEVNKKNEGN